MELRFSKAQAELLNILFGPPFDFSRHSHRHADRYTVNLSRFSKEDVDHLKDEVDRFLHVRGMANISKDLEMWLELNDNEDAAAAVKMSSLKKSLAVFYHFFYHMERKHVYRCIQENDENRWLCYHVENIVYHKPEKFTPEHLTFNCSYYLRGEKASFSFSMYRENIWGKTPAEALQSAGMRAENPVLRDQYLEELTRYEEVVDDIGRQFLAVGIADDSGVDDATSDKDTHYSWSRQISIFLDKDGQPAPVVVDIEKETDQARRRKGTNSEKSDFWSKSNEFFVREGGKKEADEIPEDDATTSLEIPLHPYVTIFHLKKHIRLKTHVANLTEYEYDGSLSDKLVLPPEHTRIIDCLMHKSKQAFSDVVKNKAGGVVVLSQGPPGTGKTLTAEIYSESLKRPLYAVQCSQLGLDSDSLEKNLSLVLSRGNRWGAVTLLDEADVYIHQRGNDLHQNAIVGVFLRVLEYQSGVLFLTTNRGDTVDDAILSRCTVRIPYSIPTPGDQAKIWRAIAESNNVELSIAQISNIVVKHADLSGRDIKNLFKLAMMVYGPAAESFTPEVIMEMRVFKATTNGK